MKDGRKEESKKEIREKERKVIRKGGKKVKINWNSSKKVKKKWKEKKRKKRGKNVTKAVLIRVWWDLEIEKRNGHNSGRDSLR